MKMTVLQMRHDLFERRLDYRRNQIFLFESESFFWLSVLNIKEHSRSSIIITSSLEALIPADRRDNGTV